MHTKTSFESTARKRRRVSLNNGCSGLVRYRLKDYCKHEKSQTKHIDKARSMFTNDGRDNRTRRWSWSEQAQNTSDKKLTDELTYAM